MELFSLLLEKLGTKGIAFSHLNETQRIIRILAVAVFYNEEVTEEEIIECNKIIRHHFSKLDVEDDEIELIKKEFQSKLNEYQNDRTVFADDKKEFFSGFTDERSKEDIIELMLRVFESDGLDEKEKSAIETLRAMN